MKESNRIVSMTRRRFMAMLGALGTMLTWPVRVNSESRLSRHEADFYREGRHDDS